MIEGEEQAGDPLENAFSGREGREEERRGEERRGEERREELGERESRNEVKQKVMKGDGDTGQ